MRTGLASTSTLVDVPDAKSLPLRLAPAQPNPARRVARLDYGVAADEVGRTLEIAVFDLGGRRLRVLASGAALPGRASATWDLRDAAGDPVRAGVYFARLTLAGRSETQRFVVLP